MTPSMVAWVVAISLPISILLWSRGSLESLYPIDERGRPVSTFRFLLLVEPLLVDGAGELGHRAGEEGAGGIEAFRVLGPLSGLDAEAIALLGGEEARHLDQVLRAGPGHFGDRVAAGCGVRLVDEIGQRLGNAAGGDE